MCAVEILRARRIKTKPAKRCIISWVLGDSVSQLPIAPASIAMHPKMSMVATMKVPPKITI